MWIGFNFKEMNKLVLDLACILDSLYQAKLASLLHRHEKNTTHSPYPVSFFL